MCVCMYVCNSFCWFEDLSIATMKIQYGFCYRKSLAQISSVLPHLLIALHTCMKHGQKKALQEGFLLVTSSRREELWVLVVLFVCLSYGSGTNYKHYCSLQIFFHIKIYEALFLFLNRAPYAG